MRKITVKIILAIFLLSLNASFVFAQANEIQTFLESQVASKRTKGIVVGVIDANGRQVFSAGKLSDKDPRKPNGNTLFEIASITKVFTTLLLAEASLKNRVSLDDPISKFLPKDVKTPTRNGKEITLLNLATHTSGMPRFPHNYDYRSFDSGYTVNEMYEYLSNFKPETDFGKRFKYSNTGMALLGNILSVAEGKEYENLVAEQILKPLQMSGTVFSATPELSKNMAVGHSPYGKSVSYYFEGSAFNPTGGLRSNVNDLLNFAAANLGLMKTELSPALEIFQTKRGRLGQELGYDADIDYDYSMGWNIWTKRGKTIYWKDGTSFGFRSFICLDKANKKAVVILSNTDNPINDIGLHIIDSTYELKPFTYRWQLLDTLNSTIKTKGIDAAIKQYYQLKQGKKEGLVFHESVLDHIGNDLLEAKKLKSAVKIFELNVKEYPKSPLVYESLGEFFRKTGKTNLAIENFEKVIELDSKNERVIWILQQLRK